MFVCGWQDLDRDDVVPGHLRKAPAEEVHALFVREARERKHGDRVREARLRELGFEVEHAGEILL